jgi:3-phenylpropionate/trans-cinnamate dioxygenase ferredoxin reductase subunit
MVTLDDNSVLEYDRLLIATGSVTRRIPAKGADLPGVYYLRSIADVERIREDLLQAKRLVIVGGGYIGLEVAATARAAGLDVTVLEMASRVMNRVVCPEISSFFEAEHTSRGVKIVTNARVETGRRETGRVNSVVTADGAHYPADLVVVGVGVTANDESRSAGLECLNGVVVDSFCQTSDEYIYAAGDCTSHQNKHYGCTLRLESVDNAFEQATAAASNMLGAPLLHDKIPWFWSDQYDLKLVIVGLCQNHDAVVVRGERDSRSFSVCYLRGGELLAVDTVNQTKDQMAAKTLIGARLRPNLDRLSDPRIPLAECV